MNDAHYKATRGAWIGWFVGGTSSSPTRARDTIEQEYFRSNLVVQDSSGSPKYSSPLNYYRGAGWPSVQV